jgi:REP element-mobilizing transposase RayT
MKFDPETRHSESIRLKDYDYSSNGAYFVTICSDNRKTFFGKITNGEMKLNEYGEIAYKFWGDVSNHFPHVVIDYHVVMPNHIHAIITINNPDIKTENNKKPKLGQIVAYYKYQTTKIINQLRGASPNSVWQRDYYEHIVRNEDDLNEIREYIINNPLKWELDKENPEFQKNK